MLTLLASIDGHKSATAAHGVEEREASQSGQTEVESPLMQIFGGTYRSTVSAPDQPDAVTIENWRSIQLDIQVYFPSSFFHHIPVTDIRILQKHESVHAMEDALLRIPHLQPVQLGQSGLGEPSRKLLVEVLPPVLVLHLKRFVYDASANGVVKINKPVQFGPELEVPPGTVFCFVFLVLAKTKSSLALWSI